MPSTATIDQSMGWNLRNQYADLPQHLWRVNRPTRVSDPQQVCFNCELANELGLNLDGVTEDQLAQNNWGQACAFAFLMICSKW